MVDRIIKNSTFQNDANASTSNKLACYMNLIMQDMLLQGENAVPRDIPFLRAEHNKFRLTNEIRNDIINITVSDS